MMTTAREMCLICAGTSREPVVSIYGVPTLCNRLCASEDEAANAPRGNPPATINAAPLRKNSRRSMSISHIAYEIILAVAAQRGASRSRTASVSLTSGRVQSTSPSAMKRGCKS